MSHIERSIGGPDFANTLLFVASASTRPGGRDQPGVRSAMARAAALWLAADEGVRPVVARHDASDRSVATLRAARHRSRRYAERGRQLSR